MAKDFDAIGESWQLKPRFECTAQGVFFYGVTYDENGQAKEKPPLRLADRVEVLGRGKDETGAHYCVIKWHDAGKAQRGVIPMRVIGFSECWAQLQERGIAVQSGRTKRDLLADYLQQTNKHNIYTISNKAGWINNSYILPNGDVVGNSEAIYNGEVLAGYQARGTPEEWRAQVARYAAGNSRLLLALGAAFAAPLLERTGEQNGGFHIFGDSSDGKTTAALVALSVLGNPQQLKLSWRGTDLGFSNAALARNDGLLVLDEIGEAHAKTISKTAYSVINGKSKIQGAKDGGNRASQEWRVLLFSTGEHSLNAYMTKGGETWEAGQAVRLPSIPAATTYGIYEDLHGFQDGAALSEHLQAATQAQHGTAFKAWLELLSQTPAERVREAQAAFMQTLPSLNGQARRVAKHFALAAAALELARDILGLAQGVGMAGVKQCFDDWFKLNGAGKQEDRQTMKDAEDFMQQYGYSARFAHWEDKQTSPNHAGFRKRNGADKQGDEIIEFWVNAGVFEGEILRGRDIQKGCKVLHAARWLIKNGNRWKHQRKNSGRYYVLVGIAPPETPDNLD